MDVQEFVDKLLPKASIEDVDFACDLERVLADEVKYLRRVIETMAELDAEDESRYVRELRTRIDEKNKRIQQLEEENRFLRRQLSQTSG